MREAQGNKDQTSMDHSLTTSTCEPLPISFPRPFLERMRWWSPPQITGVHQESCEPSAGRVEQVFARPKKLRFSVFPALLGVCLLLVWNISYGQTSADPAWQELESRHTRIRYRSLDDLRKLNRSVDYAPGSWGLKGLFGFTGSENFSEALPKKMDALYERVQQILDMRKKMKKVSIHVYPNKQQLHAAFREIFNAPCPVRAWYAHEHNTIYLNAKDVHEGILAHEMAHAVIDHYLLVRPPKATAEILARYVDAHLFE